MARSLSMDLRERVVGAVEGGLSRRRAAERFGVSVSSAVRWMQAVAREGTAAPKRQGGDRRSDRIEAHGAMILTKIAEEPDATLEELQAWLRAEHAVSFAVSTLWRFFDRHGVSLKKRPVTRPSRTGPTF